MALKDNLQLLLRLNEGSGQTIVDYGPNNAITTVSGTDQRTLVAGMTGTYRNGIQMNKNYHLCVADNSIFDFTGAHTVHCRLLCTVSTGSEYIVAKTNDAFTAGYEAIIASGGQGMYFTRPLGINYQPANNITGVWKDVVWRVNYVNGSGQAQLFVNGVLTSFQGNAAWSPANSDRPLGIGQIPTTTASPSTRYQGAIQDVILYDRGLSDSEVALLAQQHYSSGTVRTTIQNGSASAYNFGLGTGTYYKIIGGADSGLFNVSNAGQLNFNTVPNANTPTDSNKDGAYEVTVMLFNNNVMSDQTIIVSPYRPARRNLTTRYQNAFFPPVITGLIPDATVVTNLDDRFDDYTYYTSTGTG